jgi:hypothetical protein
MRRYCAYKKVFKSKASVTKALAEIKWRQEKGESVWVKRAYWCDFHQGWHLTSTDLKRRKVASDFLVPAYSGLEDGPLPRKS